MGNFYSSTIALFRYYKSLGEKAMAQLEDELLFKIPNDGSNPISVMVYHLEGNMLSRWTDFLSSDGEKPWRNRDREFQEKDTDRAALMEAWENGWACLFQALEAASGVPTDTVVYIRNEGHTVQEAIHRQLAHYAYHIGQIVYVARLLKGASFKSLSIPKGQSATYNAKMFNKEKSKTHFTDSWIGEDKNSTS